MNRNFITTEEPYYLNTGYFLNYLSNDELRGQFDQDKIEVNLIGGYGVLAMIGMCREAIISGFQDRSLPMFLSDAMGMTDSLISRAIIDSRERRKLAANFEPRILQSHPTQVQRLSIQDRFYNERRIDIHLFGNLSAWLAVSILRHYGIDCIISSHKIDQNNGVDFIVFDPDEKIEPISVDITTTHGPSFLKKSAKLGDRKFPVALCEVPTKWNTAFRILLELVMLGDNMPHSLFPMHLKPPSIRIDEIVRKTDLQEGLFKLPESILIAHEPLVLQALREMQELWKNSTLKAIKSPRPDMANEVEKLIELTEKVIRTNK